MPLLYASERQLQYLRVSFDTDRQYQMRKSSMATDVEYSFFLIETVPGSCRIEMMLKMIPEEPAGEHRKEMMLLLCSGAVDSHVLCMGQTMGKEGPEGEQLKGCQKGGEHPQEDDVGKGSSCEIDQGIEQQCHGDDLQDSHIGKEEMKEPGEVVLALHTEIRVL